MFFEKNLESAYSALKHTDKVTEREQQTNKNTDR